AGWIFPLYLLELFLCWFGPVSAGFITMYFVIQAAKKDSYTITKTLAKGFVLKMVFYGLYIIIFFKLYSFKPIQFLCSFAGFFLGLHALEAVVIKDLSKPGGFPNPLQKN
ncbi:MAG: hypothetical protein VX957_00940, partial [Candidatus Neomarinimicrobiota bacterium]|nr:hypothetical protein [Candidatus Neomarinimicrobiota bacterium]